MTFEEFADLVDQVALYNDLKMAAEIDAERESKKPKA